MLLGISLLVFFLIHLIPGDPVLMMVEPGTSGEDVELMRRQLGLDKPIHVQYFIWLGKVLRGNMGTSVYTHLPVLKELLTPYLATVQLALVSITVAIVVGLITGIVSATYQYSFLDSCSRVVAIFGVSAPVFWVGLVFGTSMGTVSGYFGGTLDNLIMRIVDVMMAFPGILLALSLVTFLGAGFESTIIALGIATIPRFARISRGSVLIAKEQDFVEAARALGSNHTWIIFRHILPNCLAPISVEFSLRIAVIILMSAGLSFLGLGVQPPTPEWGAMMSNGRAYLRVAPHIITFPDMAIMLVVLGFNLLGDGLRDLLDPRLKQ